MDFVRILIDGYSLLHSWPELCGSNPPHSEAARDALSRKMSQYHDVTGIPVTIFYDGCGDFMETAPESTPRVEIIYSAHRQTADQLIERAALRFIKYGNVAVVTNDVAESSLVRQFGCYVFSCRSFIQMVEEAIEKVQERAENLRRVQKTQFGKKLLDHE